MSRFSGAQLRTLVERQLGRPALIPYQVELLCPYGWPAVLRSAPARGGGEPNPNIYYLSCPYLRKELARLEDSGAIAMIEQRASREAGLARAITEAQSRHAAEWEEASGAAAAESGAPTGPRIAAASGDLSIKCLHAHYAFSLAHPGYRVGAIILELLPRQWCDDERCRGWMAELAGEGGEA